MALAMRMRMWLTNAMDALTGAPPAVNNGLLLEDNSSFILLEDSTSILLLE